MEGTRRRREESKGERTCSEPLAMLDASVIHDGSDSARPPLHAESGGYAEAKRWRPRAAPHKCASHLNAVQQPDWCVCRYVRHCERHGGRSCAPSANNVTAHMWQQSESSASQTRQPAAPDTRAATDGEGDGCALPHSRAEEGTGVAEARDRSNSENPPAHGRHAQPADVRIPQADLSSARPNPTMSTTRGNMI